MDNKMEALNEECAKYFDALYAPERKVYVFGDGDTASRVALVGEAPGEQETLLQKPFVGKAGRNLEGFLQLSGLSRSRLYITNVVKFRPVKLSESGRASNRPPTREEIELWTPWLRRELAIVAPEYIVTLGNVPLRALTGKAVSMGAAHGKLWIEPVLSARLFALYHPASVVYNPSLRPVYEADVRAFAALVGDLGQGE